jgi:hypothetical protein
MWARWTIGGIFGTLGFGWALPLIEEAKEYAMRFPRLSSAAAAAALFLLAACGPHQTERANVLIKPHAKLTETAASAPTTFANMSVWHTTVMSDPHLHLMFWGSQWQKLRGGITKATVANAVAEIINSNYTTALSNYTGNSSVVIRQPKLDDTTDCGSADPNVGMVLDPDPNPPKTIPDVIRSCASASHIALAKDTFVLLMLPPDLRAISNVSEGFHLIAPVDPNAPSGDQFVYAAVGYFPSISQTFFDLTDSISHELLEAITDPHQDEIYGTAESTTDTGGQTFDAPTGCSADPSSTCEIADVCEAYGEDGESADGVAFASWWSQDSAQSGHCVKPNVQTALRHTLK